MLVYIILFFVSFVIHYFLLSFLCSPLACVFVFLPKTELFSAYLAPVLAIIISIIVVYLYSKSENKTLFYAGYFIYLILLAFLTFKFMVGVASHFAP